ncbi:MAG: capsular polysaccharide biosynthesis protein, partial [Pseudomonadota bacterium]
MVKANRARLYVYNLGFLTQRRVRRILDLSGYEIRIGRPTEGDLVGVWGKSPTSHRGETAADKHGTDIIRIEDAFLRSLMPGRTGAPPLGLMIDKQGVHFDPTQPSDLETILATHPLDDTVLLDRARAGITRLQETHLTKYTAFDADIDAPDPGYVLVIDQTRDDAAVT